jgi:hypothetical protein
MDTKDIWIGCGLKYETNKGMTAEEFENFMGKVKKHFSLLTNDGFNKLFL